jgi:hypothetical protein
MWFDPGLAGLFITSTLLHLGEDINLLVVSFNHKVMIIGFMSRHLVLWSLENLMIYELGGNFMIKPYL